MLDRIRASLPSLAPAEQRVGNLVLADPRAFANLPVSELAERSHVSKPTVVRFCRSMGYDGLSDFKLKLAGTVSEGVPFIHRSVDVDDKTGDVVVKVIDNTVAAFLKYRNDASTAAIDKAATVLAGCDDRGFAILFAGDIAKDEPCGIAEALGGLAAGGIVDVGEHHFGASGDEHLGTGLGLGGG